MAITIQTHFGPLTADTHDGLAALYMERARAELDAMREWTKSVMIQSEDGSLHPMPPLPEWPKQTGT